MIIIIYYYYASLARDFILLNSASDNRISRLKLEIKFNFLILCLRQYVCMYFEMYFVKFYLLKYFLHYRKMHTEKYYSIVKKNDNLVYFSSFK